MNNTKTNISPNTSKYWNMIKDLDDKTKIELISLLSSSMLTQSAPAKTDKNWLKGIAGSWEDTRSAEEIIEDIRSSRYYGTREIASFDD